MGRNPLKRPPDVIIGEDKEDPYLRRWWIIPRNRFFNIYLHHFCKSDEDRALHDHPWWSIGILLKGFYIEHRPVDQERWIKEGDRRTETKVFEPFIPKFRSSNYIHRIQLFRDVTTHKEVPVWTIFITGPKVRDWGFWCDFGFRLSWDFLDKTGTKRGRGCD